MWNCCTPVPRRWIQKCCHRVEVDRKSGQPDDSKWLLPFPRRSEGHLVNITYVWIPCPPSQRGVVSNPKHPGSHDTLARCWPKDGPASATLARPWASTGPVLIGMWHLQDNVVWGRRTLRKLQIHVTCHVTCGYYFKSWHLLLIPLIVICPFTI